MSGTPEGSTESGFMETLGIELVTPGLQDKKIVAFPWVVTSTGPGGFMICVSIL